LGKIEDVVTSKMGSFVVITDREILVEIEGREFPEIEAAEPKLARISELMVAHGYEGKPVADGIEYDLPDPDGDLPENGRYELG
jgi:hypothetical protein